MIPSVSCAANPLTHGRRTDAMIRLLSLDITPLGDEALFAAYYNRMSPYRRERIDVSRSPADRRLRLGAGILLDHALGNLGLRECDMHYTTVKNGKPCFASDVPLHFNISHSDPYVIVALSDHEIGCDVERVREIDLAVARRFFCRSEYETVMASEDPAERNRTFFRLWTLKESFLKVTGEGLRLPMNRFAIDLSQSPVTVKCETIAGDYRFHEYSELSGFCMACCMEKDDSSPVPECMNHLITR